MTRKELYHSLLTLLLLSACAPKSENGDSSAVKFQQYFVQGQVLYQKHCSNCHQANGKGLGRIYPPVDRSDFMDKNFEAVICTIKYGSQDPLTVNGVEYNMAMKGNPQLTELEVAEITTYIYNSWSRQKGLVNVKQVTEILEQCNN